MIVPALLIMAAWLGDRTASALLRVFRPRRQKEAAAPAETAPTRNSESARSLVVCTASGDPLALVIARDQDWLMGYTLLALEVQGRAILARERAHG